MTRRLQGGWLGRHTRLPLFGLLAGALLTSRAEAQVDQVQRDGATPNSPAASEAEASYGEAISEAVAHYSAGRWRRAQEAFARAHTLQPSARTLRGLGLTHFYLESFAAAREAFEQALTDARKPLPEDQRREIAELLRTCARESGRFELRVTPPAARVELDGTPIDRRVLLLDRGEHVLVASAEGYASERLVFTVNGGEERALDVALKTQPAPAPLGSAAVPSTEARAQAPLEDYSDSEPPKSGGRVFTWVAAAAVPAFAGAAAVIWFTGKGKHAELEDQCAIDRCDPAEAQRRFDDAGLDAYATWTSVSLAASGVALAAAAVLFVIEGDGTSEAGLAFSAGPQGASLSGRF